MVWSSMAVERRGCWRGKGVVAAVGGTEVQRWEGEEMVVVFSLLISVYYLYFMM